MELTEQDKDVLKAAVEQIWRKGAHTPQEAAVGHNFTQLVARLIKPDETKPEKK